MPETKVPLSELPRLDDLIGQSDCVDQLKHFGQFYSQRGEGPEHVLITGSVDIGKRTFAGAFAKTYNSGLRQVDAKELRKQHDLTALLTSLELWEALLLLNMQDLKRDLIETLSNALANCRIDLLVGVGSKARVHPFQLKRFSLLATASRVTDVSPELLKYFALRLTLQPYSNSELQTLVCIFAARKSLKLSDNVVPMLVSASDRTPASIERLLDRFARLGIKDVTDDDANNTLASLGLRPRQISHTSQNIELDKLSGIEFEKVILSLLQRMGFRAEMTRTTGDGGIDIIANLEKPIIGGRYVIQCKRFADALIGAPVVREFYGAFVADRKAVKGIFITTSDFTAQAREFAEHLPLELIDRQQLTNLLSEFRSDN